MSKTGEHKSTLTKQLKCLNESYEKYNADADLESMKKLLERGRAAKVNTDKLENEIKSINIKLPTQKIISIKIFLLGNVKLFLVQSYVFSCLK